MGQAHPKPESHPKPKSHSKLNSDILREHLLTNLPPAPRTYTDDFWRKGNEAFWFSDHEIEALNQFRQLELESLASDDEKESKIKEFCTKYCYARIPLDVDKDGYPRSFILIDSTLNDIDEEELEKYGETLVICIGIEDSDASIYLGGSGKLYMFLNDSLKVLNNYKDIGTKSSDVFQN